MKPDKLTVHEIFEKERRYVVPLYQRPYVWKQEDHWEPFWDDISKQAEYCLKDDHRVGNKSHFLGAIVLNANKIVGRSIARSEIIDGQQRLTTLQLFLAALRDYAQSVGDDTAEQLNRLIRNPSRNEDCEEIFKVWPTNSDRDTYVKVMTACSLQGIQNHFSGSGQSNFPRMAEAYRYFGGAVKSFIELGNTEEERSNRLFAIVQALRTALQFVVIELEESDDPQIIFETLNARGQALLPSDLIRNFIFMQAANRKDINSDDLYNTYWRTLDERRASETDSNGEDRFWHIMERQGRLIRPRIDLFIFHYLVMKTESQLNIGQLFREFRNWYCEQNITLQEFLKDLNFNSVNYAKLAEPIGSDRLLEFARRLKSLDTSTVYPLLLFLMGLSDTQLPLSKLNQIVIDLESYLVRRFICMMTAKNYNHFFAALLIKAVRAVRQGQVDLHTEIRSELLRSTEPSSVWPNDTEFRNAWLSNPLYVKSRVDRSVVVLKAIEEQIRTAKNEQLTFLGDLTVEHLLPQNPEISDYPYAQTMPIQKDETPERCRARIIHTIGNLTLLTSSLNSSVSNGPFPQKRVEITKNSDLRINAWLRTDTRSNWSEEDILARGEELFKYALKIWPHPNTP